MGNPPTAMTMLVDLFQQWFGFLLLDPRYRVTDFATDGGANASITVAGEVLTWQLTNERGRLQLSIVPTLLPELGFWISLLRQYLDGMDEIEYLSAPAEMGWAQANIGRIEALFSDAGRLRETCDRLRALMRTNAEKEWR